jgi:hypothetical protein
VCVIGLRTSQLGFIPANVFCIVVYGFSIRSWIREAELGIATPDTKSAELMDRSDGTFSSATSDG